MRAIRTRFGEDIVAEVLPPLRRGFGGQAPKNPSKKVVILCKGMPTNPASKWVMEYWSKKGFWVILPRYRGTWESGGRFLKESPHRDVLDIIDALDGSFENFWKGEEFTVPHDEIYVVGSSFGGPAALLASLDNRVKKVVALSPVVDWTQESDVEPMDWFARFVRNGFGEGYRFDQADWDRLARGEFYQPMRQLKEFDPEKILLVHAMDDDVVKPQASIRFAEEVGCDAVFTKTGGHASSKFLKKWLLSRKVQKFLHS